MKHRHHNMICAKAANMDLVVFAKASTGWRKFTGDFPDFGLDEYFLCLPQHKEACLHWLNGGKVQVINDTYHEWEDCGTHAEYPEWYAENWMMSSKNKYRIKPRKEKRWIAVRNEDKRVSDIAYPSLDDAKADVNPNHWSFHEIEIEI